jgi:hypothetical protein
MTRCKLLGLTLTALLFLTALGAAPARAQTAAAPQALPAVGAGSAAPVACGLDLTKLATPSAQGETCAAQPKSQAPDFLVNSKRLGYCHCGCVNQRVCRTSDDCGGASCDQFISCC